MSKIIDSSVQVLIDGKNYAGIMLVKMYFDSGIKRYCNASQSIYWDESSGGEVEYEGIGHISEISMLPETNELGAQTIQLNVGGIPNETITDIFSDGYAGNAIYIWYGILDMATYAVVGGQDGPVLVFAGLMDNANFEFGEVAQVSLNATSRLADWERTRGGRYNQGYQKTYIDPTDTGFKYVQAIQNKEIIWGNRHVVDYVDDKKDFPQEYEY